MLNIPLSVRDVNEARVFLETTHSGALSASLHFVCCEITRDCRSPPIQANCLRICLLCLRYIMCLTSLGLPGCNGGGVLWRGGGCALPLPLLHPGSLCLHCHAVCHSQGMETNCLQVSSFSASLPARPHFLILQPSLCSFTYCISQPARVCVCVCVCEYILQLQNCPDVLQQI